MKLRKKYHKEIEMKRKKLISLLLVLIMIVSLTPTMAFALGETGEESMPEITEDSGTTGTDVTDGKPALTDDSNTSGFEAWGLTAGDSTDITDKTYSLPLSWTGGGGVVYIQVKNGETLIQGPNKVDVTDIEKTYTISKLNRGVNYTIMIADNAGMNGADSIEYSMAEKVRAVTGLVAHSGYNSVILRWTPVPDAESYTVYRATSKNGRYYMLSNKVTNSNIENDRLDGNKVTYKSTGLSKNVTYYYKVYAVKNNESSNSSQIVSNKAVRPIYMNVTFKKKVKLKSHGGIKRTTTFKKGQRVTTEGFGGGKYKFWYNGSYYYSSFTRVKKCTADYQKSSNYSKYTAESFVNSINATSKTNKLIWVSTYTQHLYVFTGSKGHWKLISGKDWEVSTGKAASPTPTGFNKKIYAHKKKHSGIKWWCKFQTMNSIHGKRKSYKIGVPGSHGCVRNYDSNAKWIYDNCKNGTGVVIF